MLLIIWLEVYEQEQRTRRLKCSKWIVLMLTTRSLGDAYSFSPKHIRSCLLSTWWYHPNFIPRAPQLRIVSQLLHFLSLLPLLWTQVEDHQGLYAAFFSKSLFAIHNVFFEQYGLFLSMSNSHLWNLPSWKPMKWILLSTNRKRLLTWIL